MIVVKFFKGHGVVHFSSIEKRGVSNSLFLTNNKNRRGLANKVSSSATALCGQGAEKTTMDWDYSTADVINRITKRSGMRPCQSCLAAMKDCQGWTLPKPPPGVLRQIGRYR